MNLPAIVIARGGSRRIPRKNVKEFCGRPLVEWSIIQAKTSKAVTDVFLSTDDDEIAEIGEQNNINIIRRPSMDSNVSGDVPFKMALEWMQGQGYESEIYVPLLPTFPLRLPSDIDNAISIYWSIAKPIGSYVVSCIIAYSGFYMPVDVDAIKQVAEIRWWGGHPFRYDQNGAINVEPVTRFDRLKLDRDIRLVRNWKATVKYRKAEIEKIHHIVPYIMKDWQAYDIDSQDDFDINEWLFKHFILEKGYYK